MEKIIKIIPILFIVLIFACDKEEACVGCNLNPKIKLKFESIWKKAVTDSLVNLVNEEVDKINELLEGQLTIDERKILEKELSDVKKEASMLEDELSLFRSGKTKMDFIGASGSVLTNLFQDTVIGEFSIPVDMQHDTSTYFFAYHGFIDTLQLIYQREIDQTFDGVRMRLLEIGINKDINTFDSIKVKCYSLECSNDRATIHIYY